MASIILGSPTDPGAPLSPTAVLPAPVIILDDTLEMQGYPEGVPFPAIPLAQPVQPGYVILLEDGSAATQQSLWALGQYDKSLWSDVLVFSGTSCQLTSDDGASFPTPSAGDTVKFINEFNFGSSSESNPGQYTVYTAGNTTSGVNVYKIESTVAEPVTLTFLAAGLAAIVRRRSTKP